MASRKTYNTTDCKQQLLLIEISKGEYGGYKQDLLVDSLNEMEIDFYVCTKCNGIMRNACHIGAKQDPVCEMCKVQRKVSIPMEKSRNNIPKLRVYCPLSGRGCVWKGSIGETDGHLDECIEFILPCSNVCGDILKRSELKNHCENECLIRKVNCIHCKIKFKYKDIDYHFTTCPELPLLCPNECMETFLRKNISSHIEKDCPKTIVHCTNGCGVIMKRSALSIHCKNDCQLRIVNCKYCEVVMKYKELENHYKICLEFPSVCPNGCLRSLVRIEMNSHIKEECPNTLVACLYKEMGCKILSKRCELKQHEKLFESNHLKVTKIFYLNKLQKLELIIQDKDDSIDRLQTELLSVKEENERLKCSLSLYSPKSKIKLTQEFDSGGEATKNLSELEALRMSSRHLKNLSEQALKMSSRHLKYGESLPKRKKGHLKIEYLYVYRSRSRAFSFFSQSGWKRYLVALEDGKLLFYNNEKEYRESIESEVDTVHIQTWDRVCPLSEVASFDMPALPYKSSHAFAFAGTNYEQACFFIANNSQSVRQWMELLEEHRRMK